MRLKKSRHPRLNPSREIQPKVVGGGILRVFRDNYRLAVASDVMSRIAVGYVGVDAHVKFGDSKSNHS